MRLPFKDETRPSENYRTARGQLNQLVHRVENSEQFSQQYNKVVKSYVEKEFIKQIPNQPVEGHYMPHHAVFKKSANIPLNDCLVTGPSLTTKLHEILLQFCQGKYAVTADISKAFHRIIVHEEDRKFLILHEHSELHVFTDASSRTYGAAVYTVNNIQQRSNLLISKARVAPCQEHRLTIPKLELKASLIGARLIRYLSNLFKFDTIYLWSDSKVAISWITSDRDVKDVYIANRVAEVKTLVISIM